MRLTNLISVLPFWNTSTFGVLVSKGKALFEAGLHAISGGLMSAVEGGKFMAGALSGFVSSMVSSGIQSLGQTGATVTTVVDGKGVTEALQNGFGQNYMKAVMVVAGGLSGGLSSTVAGGNFWQGMRQGLITSGLNHMAHIGAIALNRAKGFVVAGIYGGGGKNGQIDHPDSE